MWKKIKKWLLSKVEDLLMKEIDKLDKYEVMLIELLRENIDADEKAAKIVKTAKVELTKAIDKAFAWKWLSSKILGKAKSAMITEVKSLSKYEPVIAGLIEDQLDKAEELAPKLVNMAQDYLKVMVAKYIKKI